MKKKYGCCQHYDGLRRLPIRWEQEPMCGVGSLSLFISDISIVPIMILLHGIEPQLLYELKTNPSFFDPAYRQWNDEKKAKRAAKDSRDIQVLEKMLVERNIDVKSLKERVRSC